MILEIAILNIIPGQQPDFESAFAKAQTILANMEGYISHQLLQCVEISNRYTLLVNWQTLEHHTQGFRSAPAYQEWKTLLHHFYDPFPSVEHYCVVFDDAREETISSQT